ncbi:hypothetical protein GC175_16435 [bacterium]|nr:hypothetical protein [bacterium]
MKRIGKWITRVLLGLLALILLAALVLFIINLRLPTEMTSATELDDLTRARVDEIFHLRRTLGDEVWPGFGQAEIPVILYNEEYAFLVGYPGEPSAGWTPVGADQPIGAAWERVNDDLLAQGHYFRTPLPEDGTTPQAFTVRVDDVWVASLGQYEWMKFSLTQQIRADLPPVLRQIMPYTFFVDQLLNGTDGHIAAVVHESFHAYQAIEAEDRLQRAEVAARTGEPAYPWHDAEVMAAWQSELDLLANAVRAESDDEARQLARQFLTQRAERRAGLASTLVVYEKHREWVEGLARYAELEIWHAADTADTYTPVTALASDADFDSYRNYTTRWNREVDQIRRMAGDEGDGRFYYSGMAQAVLLDRFMPGWKTQIMDEGVWLDTLLVVALTD